MHRLNSVSGRPRSELQSIYATRPIKSIKPSSDHQCIRAIVPASNLLQTNYRQKRSVLPSALRHKTKNHSNWDRRSRPFAAFHPSLVMLRRGPSDQTFAATASLRAGEFTQCGHSNNSLRVFQWPLCLLYSCSALLFLNSTIARQMRMRGTSRGSNRRSINKGPFRTLSASSAASSCSFERTSTALLHRSAATGNAPYPKRNSGGTFKI